MKESIEREIEVVETIISQLKNCLAVYYKQKMHDEFKVTMIDIQKCKKELRYLIAKREKEKEQAQDAAAVEVQVERSGTGFL